MPACLKSPRLLIAVAAVAVAMLATGCASTGVDSRVLTPDLPADLRGSEPYALTVRAEEPMHQAVLREFAQVELPPLLRLVDDGRPGRGQVELLMTHSVERVSWEYDGLYGWGYYPYYGHHHHHHGYFDAYYSGYRRTRTTDYQLADLVLTIKDAEGRRIYSAHRRHYGDSVPDAARNALLDIARQLEKDLAAAYTK